MKFEKAETVEALAYDCKMADFVRAENRTRINKLFNGHPCYSQTEVEENNIAVNVNFLEATRIAHDARSQFAAAFQKPGNYFKATTDFGPPDKAPAWSAIVTREVNRIMKRSIPFYECFRSSFASDILHGIGPSAWRTCEHWCPEPLGIEDVLIPSNTLLTMQNLPFFFLYHSWTAPELMKMVRGPNADPGWNQDLAERCIRWVDTETTAMMGDSDWPDVWSPEKMEERLKGDGAYYASDRCPTINVFDFFFWSDEKDNSGWKRRVILDSWSTPSQAGQGLVNRSDEDANYPKSFGQFLYTSDNKNHASKREEIVHFQFADLSAVAPFKYHTIRSLGFLLYAVCHLQNRLRCRFNEAVFEAMLIYMRVKSQDDIQRALKVKMANFAFFDETMSFIPASERHVVQSNLAELGLNENARIIQDNSSSYTANPQARDKQEKTKFQVMAEVNASTSLVAAALAQAYIYQKPQYTEIFRRFCIPNSSDPDVREFRARCFRQKVPAKVLTPDAWEIEPERVMGAGNKTLEMAISEQLMQLRPMMDPEPQQKVLHDVVLAITDDPARAKQLVPEKAVHITDAVHDAQLAAGTLMQGLPVALKTGMNHIEYVDTLMATMAAIVVKIQKQQQGVATPQQLEGLQMMQQNISQHIGIIAQNKQEGPRVKKYGDQLGKLMNMVKAFAQRLQEQQKAQAEAAQQQNGNGGLDGKDKAKIAGMILAAKTKSEIAKKSAAQRTAQKQIQFQQKIQQEQQRHQADVAAEDLRTAAEIDRNRLRSLGEDTEGD